MKCEKSCCCSAFVSYSNGFVGVGLQKLMNFAIGIEYARPHHCLRRAPSSFYLPVKFIACKKSGVSRN